MSKKNKPILGITMGDPSGIGPEIIIKALDQKVVYEICNPVVVGDTNIMKEAVKICKKDLLINSISKISDANFEFGIVNVYDMKNADMNFLEFGKTSAIAGHAAFVAVRKVIELAMQKEIDGTVTGPINKVSINLAGYHFSGHTEIYAQFTGTKKYAMLLLEGNTRIIHVSTHVSLRKACELVKKDRVLDVIDLLNSACKKLGIKNPKLGVAGLNPHASDGGLFGNEEEKEIIPAIKAARETGINVEGPIAGDILFSKGKGGCYDGCVAMYHDQGHIPFKMEGFVWNNEKQNIESIKGVNITLGLPIIRTSVDHGTAFEIAGKGIANCEAMLHAIEYAAKMHHNYNTEDYSEGRI